MNSKTRRKKERLYIAYGSNLNLEQMAGRCPTAEVIGKTELKDWRLRFRGGRLSAVATVERADGYKVPVLIWKLQPEDERALDRYEGWPHLYRKEILRITVNGKRVYAMIYIMNEHSRPYGAPSKHYFNTIMEGYKSAGFDQAALLQAAYNTAERNKKNDGDS